MTSLWRKRASSLALVAALAGFGGGAMTTGCVQDVGDIDRTQPNRIKKSDLTGDWFFAQTVTEVPSTSIFTFTGETSLMERVRWDIQENFLIAYRSYPRLGNSDPDQATEGNAYTESPVAAFAIQGHFDVRRSYDPSTGETANVIEENSYDRPWHAREFMRVDWSRNLITNFEFISDASNITNLEYFVQAEQGGEDAFHESRDQKGLEYFDFVGKMHVVPDEWGCLFTMYGWAAEDCTAAEIKVRSSFLRAGEVREYEPVAYDDRLMTKFGYFRTERFNYDQWRGTTQSGRTFLANRFPIWREVWKKDAQGQPLRDAQGQLVPIPMPERQGKPVVYHLSQDIPQDMIPASQRVADSWDKAFRKAVGAAQGKSEDEVPRMFILCHNPVAEGDDQACGPTGTVARTGDIRYNHMYWVARPQNAGLLGYGPSGADPLTGEIIFGSAYVYGAEVDTYSQYSTDLVRLLNGELTEEDVLNADHIVQEVRERLGNTPGVARAQNLKQARIPADVARLSGPERQKRLGQVKRHGIEPQTGDRHGAVMAKLKQSGLDNMLVNSEIERARTRGRYGAPGRQAPPEVRDAIAPSNWASARHMKARTELLYEKASRHNLYLSAFADDAILGYATKMQGEQDYEAVRQKIREAVYQAVMEHEVGHTVGLRHNFQGSYDSLNYKDEYWQQRKQNLRSPESMDDLYAVSLPTEEQKQGSMQEYAYSSIMDYGMRFNSDIHGLGRYDEAAIVFGYTTGHHEAAKAQSPGFVEVYENPGSAAVYMRRYQDPDSLAYPLLLENVHYTRVARSFPSLEAMTERQWVRYDQLKQERQDQGTSARVEVPYMFCSDEWIGALVSCQLFDAGADPFEMVRHINSNYRNYYTLSHFHRDRTFFWPENVLDSMYGRYFQPLTNVYQNWVFAYFYGTDDEVLDNYYFMAALSGFNLLADVVLTPEVGSYAKQADGAYRLVSYAEERGADLVVPYGPGRPQYSEYQYDSGYYFFDRVDQVGHFWDFLAAVFALTDSEATRLGVDASADSLTYSIPWYLMFEGELNEVMNSLYLADSSRMGPRVKDGQLVLRPASPMFLEDEEGNTLAVDPETGREFSLEPDGDPLHLEPGLTNQLYGVLFGMAYFTSNYSMNYPDQMHVFRLGAEAVNPGAGFEWVTFDDPLRGHRYGALKPLGDAPTSGAVRLVEQGQKWAQALSEAQDAGDEEAIGEAQYYFNEVVDRVNLARGIYDVFGVMAF